jgi:hypothetical protein
LLGNKTKECIGCLIENSDTAEEHIIQDALGCPKNFIFKDGTVCWTSLFLLFGIKHY